VAGCQRPSAHLTPIADRPYGLQQSDTVHMHGIRLRLLQRLDDSLEIAGGEKVHPERSAAQPKGRATRRPGIPELDTIAALRLVVLKGLDDRDVMAALCQSSRKRFYVAILPGHFQRRFRNSVVIGVDDADAHPVRLAFV